MHSYLIDGELLSCGAGQKILRRYGPPCEHAGEARLDRYLYKHTVKIQYRFIGANTILYPFILKYVSIPIVMFILHSYLVDGELLSLGTCRQVLLRGDGLPCEHTGEARVDQRLPRTAEELAVQVKPDRGLQVAAIWTHLDTWRKAVLMKS